MNSTTRSWPINPSAHPSEEALWGLAPSSTLPFLGDSWPDSVRNDLI
jgi:hypothetical protein